VTYIGGDIEFVVLHGAPTISLAAGVHGDNSAGIDGTFNITFPLRGIVALYGGLDADVDFHRGGTSVPLWGYFGLQVMVRRHFGIFMEADVGITDPAPNMLDFGLNVSF
jgi:hypothetical protein